MRKRFDMPFRSVMGLSSLGLTLMGLGLLPQMAWAIPGQSLRSAETWIQANPTLNPGPGEQFLIQRRSTPAQRFTFEASVFPISGAFQTPQRSEIRTERFVIVDFINDVTAERLEESLRAIYGVDIFTDYRQAEVLLAYPPLETLVSPDSELVLQGDLREGEQFAYWWELAYDETGRATSGRMAVFLREDVSGLEAQLNRNRPTID
jgi:hypothetical protein